MTHGERAERAFKLLSRAMGAYGLVDMVCSRRLSRQGIERVINLVEDALAELKQISNEVNRQR